MTVNETARNEKECAPPLCTEKLATVYTDVSELLWE
jgi:hypothetical protein